MTAMTPISAARRAELDAAARAVLAANDRGGYTVPTDRLYPFQWSWDSAFVAMGFATFDPDRALRELERLAEGQWADGMLPHIVFHAPSDTYFPGPEVWGTGHAVPTSGITQPPVFAMALRHVLAAARAARLADAEKRARRLYSAALASQRWWLTARDPEGSGLVAVLHPWETGSDNSPAWDAALARVPDTTTTPLRRRDTAQVDAAMRPRDADYRRYIHIVDAFRACGWEPTRQWAAAPFKVAEVQCTAILARANDDLAALADVFGTPAEQVEIAAASARLRGGLARQWRPSLSRFVSRDLLRGEDILVPTQAGFMPLLALDLVPGQCAAVAAEIGRWCEGLVLGLPTTPRTDPAFEPRRYWRGPVWAVVNWLLIEGLARNRLHDAAAMLREATLHAIAARGFCEYFDPITGEGLGGDRFSWTAAAWLVLSRNGRS